MLMAPVSHFRGDFDCRKLSGNITTYWGQASGRLITLAKIVPGTNGGVQWTWHPAKGTEELHKQYATYQGSIPSPRKSVIKINGSLYMHAINGHRTDHDLWKIDDNGMAVIAMSLYGSYDRLITCVDTDDTYLYVALGISSTYGHPMILKLNEDLDLVDSVSLGQCGNPSWMFIRAGVVRVITSYSLPYHSGWVGDTDLNFVQYIPWNCTPYDADSQGNLYGVALPQDGYKIKKYDSSYNFIAETTQAFPSACLPFVSHDDYIYVQGVDPIGYFGENCLFKFDSSTMGLIWKNTIGAYRNAPLIDTGDELYTSLNSHLRKIDPSDGGTEWIGAYWPGRGWDEDASGGLRPWIDTNGDIYLSTYKMGGIYWSESEV